jgi:hypothetical protein
VGRKRYHGKQQTKRTGVEFEWRSLLLSIEISQDITPYRVVTGADTAIETDELGSSRLKLR